METSAINNSKKHFICTTKVQSGYNNELIFTKSYQGDWGHWDDKIEKTSTEFNTSELDKFKNEPQNF